MRRVLVLWLAVTAMSLAGGARAAAATPPATPPMGWNSWNHFHCGVSEQVVEQTADAIVDSGLRDAGYRYVNIDDCWEAPSRDAAGRLRADPQTFPSGIAP